MALQSISNFCGKNLPGLYTIEYAPTDIINTELYTQRLDGHAWVSGIPFASGSWLQAPVFFRADQLWQQNQRESPQGRSYTNLVSGLTPKLSLAVEEQLEQMANHAYLLRLLDRNGKYWLLGTLETPFYFTASSSSGNAQQRGQYQLNWQSELPQRAFGFAA